MSAFAGHDIARAADPAGPPAVISFTVETDGRLPSGQDLGEAIELVDSKTDVSPAYYRISCAHPTHFETVLAGAGAWRDRIRGLRANASTLSHAELARPRSSTPATPPSWAPATPRCARPCRACPSSAGAAEPTTGT